MDDGLTFVRTFEAELADTGDGRTVVGRCVPFDVASTVADPPDYQPYEELFRAGAFKDNTKAPNRVLLDFEHEPGIRGALGFGVELEERNDGLHGSFKVLDGNDGDKALALVREKVLTGFSVAFRSRRHLGSVRSGRVERVKVSLDRVALCRSPAHPTAQVLAVRHRVEFRRETFDLELLARLDKLNVPGIDALRVA